MKSLKDLVANVSMEMVSAECCNVKMDCPSVSRYVCDHFRVCDYSQVIKKRDIKGIFEYPQHEAVTASVTATNTYSMKILVLPRYY